MASPWVWEPDTHRYRNTETGRFLSAADMLELRDRFIDAQIERMRSLAESLAAGQMSIDQWEAAMRQEIKIVFIDEYVMAHGGRSGMDPADWGRLGAMIGEQYGYLGGFADDINGGRYDDEGGELKAPAISLRAILYMAAGVTAFERGNALSYGMPDLPAYPGDGSTVCLTSCRCSWSIREAGDGWDCTWTLGVAEHCPDCLARAEAWAPLHIVREENP